MLSVCAVDSILVLGARSWGDVCVSNGLEAYSVVSIILIDI
jgi:hypothetical protein